MATDLETETIDFGEIRQVSVVGAAGFIGLNLCRRLLESGLKVKAIDPHEPDPGALAGHEVEHHSSLSPESIVGSSVVFHAAGSTEPASSNVHLREDMAGTVGLTLDILEAARIAGARQIVHVSSGGTVYGPDAQVPTVETAPTDPVCAYGISKLAAEGHLHLAERLHGIRAFNMRVSNPFGPWQDPNRGQGVVNAFLHRALIDTPIDLWGDGTIIRDFLHVDDVISAMLRVVSYEGDERIFNIGSGRGISIATLIGDIEMMLDREVQINRHPERRVDVPHSQLDITRANRELGWRPRIGWNEALASARDWIESHVIMKAGRS